MTQIRAAKIPKKAIKPMEVLATLCYYFPQYTLNEARRLPYRDVVLLINTANKLEAQRMLQHTQIAAAPHSKNGVAVKKLVSYFKGRANG